MLNKVVTWLKRSRQRAAAHRNQAALLECDSRMLRDIGLYRERGRLMPLNDPDDRHA
ncbi:hypothetical protein ACOJCM_08785 [Billgrantia sp. LNSP4103-1]|uniref:hypothetical protein n=1 Tax=Billgrantia sp. LNSP4103-1 TaxID=3410266 RepID=UPI00403F5B2F